MKYSNVSSLCWTVDKLAVNCIVDFDGIGEVPFTASPHDQYEHGREIYTRCVAGEFGEISEYVQEISETKLMEHKTVPQPTTTGAQTL